MRLLFVIVFLFLLLLMMILRSKRGCVRVTLRGGPVPPHQTAMDDMLISKV